MPLSNLRKSLRRLKQGFKKRRRSKHGLAELSKCRADGLPSLFVRGLECVIAGRKPEDAVKTFERIEGIRSRIASRGEEQIPVFYSPKPAKEGETLTEPGDCKTFSARHLAEGTSVPADVGQMIHLIAKDAEARTLIEFGSCVGIGASYLAAVPRCERFITMEASKELSEIATQSVKTVNADGEVYNEFFNDALDHLLPTIQNGIDFAWIDGHHEKTATIHYFERIKPLLNIGAVVAFDDIYWSQDMLDGWHHLKVQDGFEHSVDAGSCGLCLWKGEGVKPKQWSFNRFIGNGNWKPLKPAGWSDS